MSEEAAGGIKQDETPTDTPSTEPFVSDDSIVLDAFADVKGAILSRRTDIVREMLSTAQSSKILRQSYLEIFRNLALYFFLMEMRERYPV